MVTPAAGAQFDTFPERFGLGARALRLRWPAAVAGLAGASISVIAVAAAHGLLHIVVEVSVASLAMALGALAAMATLNKSYRQFVETMAKALDARDSYTAGHSCRVADYCYGTGRALGFSKRAARTLLEAAQLHDIGKIGVSDAVLQKPGPLTREEIGLIRLHPVIGRKILERTGRFKKLLPVVELHHENWDGTGYPYGMRGEEIPLEARIARVADAFDAMTSARVYRTAPTVDWAAEELRRCSGTDFDPHVAGVFLALLQNGVFNETLASGAGDSWASGAGSSPWNPEAYTELALEIAAGTARSFRQRA
ncbi:MAG TPA: HD-GYP domain-containing protein [Bryobacteraceae bacterium]|nr:HD-GYP domain-containing protein [Bryobacteraceae bacterium]